MLETNVNNFKQENKFHVDLKTETKGDYIRNEIEDNSIRITSVQIKALKVHAEKLKERLNYTLKEANDAKLAQKQEKDQFLNAQEQMSKTIQKIVTLKISGHLNIQELR